MKPNKIKIGDTIEIISFPRKYDGADAYAGIVGVVNTIDYDEKFINGRGYISLTLPNGASFHGTGLKRLKYKII